MHKKIYLSFSFKQGAKVPTLDEMVATEWWQCAFTNIGQGGYNPFLKFKRYGEGLKIYQSFLYGLIEPLPDVKPHMPMIGAQSQVLERTPQGIVMKGTSYDFSSGDFDFRETWRMDLAGNLVGELSAQASSDNKTKRVKSQAFPDFEIVSLMECKK